MSSVKRRFESAGEQRASGPSRGASPDIAPCKQGPVWAELLSSDYYNVICARRCFIAAGTVAVIQPLPRVRAANTADERSQNVECISIINAQSQRM